MVQDFYSVRALSEDTTGIVYSVCFSLNLISLPKGKSDLTSWEAACRYVLCANAPITDTSNILWTRRCSDVLTPHEDLGMSTISWD